MKKIVKNSAIIVWLIWWFTGISQNYKHYDFFDWVILIIVLIIPVFLVQAFWHITEKPQEQEKKIDNSHPDAHMDNIVPKNFKHQKTSEIKNTPCSEKNCYKRVKNIQSIQQISSFLTWCKNHTSILSAEQYPSYMQYSWGIEDPIQFHIDLIQQGYLVEMDMEQKIQYLKIVDLKNILRSQKLPVSGKKQELINRILEHIDLNSVKNTVVNQKKYYLSKKAIDFLSKCNDITSLETERQCLEGYIQDGVEKYQILSTLDKETCEICGELDGQIFLVKDAILGINFPPFHQRCRCTTVPHYDDTEVSEITRVARDVDGNAIEVPGDMTWREWKQKYL